MRFTYVFVALTVVTIIVIICHHYYTPGKTSYRHLVEQSRSILDTISFQQGYRLDSTEFSVYTNQSSPDNEDLLSINKLRNSREDILSINKLRNSRNVNGNNFEFPANATIAHKIEIFLEHMVIVTAASDNHFRESQRMLSSVHRCLPNNTLIFYNLGMNQSRTSELSTLHKNIEVRQFPYEDYMHLTHVKNLTNFAWKPIIIKEVSLKYDAILYGDSSLRLVSCDIRSVVEFLFTEFPLVGHWIKLRAVEYAHDGTLQYLNYPKERKDMIRYFTIEAGLWIMWANSTMKERFIDPWLDCALHVECIAPNGSRHKPCHDKPIHDGHYVGCHRYDQAALNIILAREFGFSPFRASSKSPINNVIRAQRMKKGRS